MQNAIMGEVCVEELRISRVEAGGECSTAFLGILEEMGEGDWS